MSKLGLHFRHLLAGFVTVTTLATWPQPTLGNDLGSGGLTLLGSKTVVSLLQTPAANGQGGDQGGTPASASLLHWGIGANGTLSSASDRDVFRLDLQGRATVDVSSSGSTDTYGYLLDSEGRSIDDDDDGGTGANFRMRQTLDGGVYYVRVDSGGGTGDYRVLARIVRAGDDHGDTPEASTLLPLSTRVAGSVTPSGDADVFRIDLPEAALLRTYTRGSADTEGQLTDSGGQPVKFADSGGDGSNFLMEAQVSSGIYYLIVTANGTGAYGVYAEADEGGGGGIQPPPADRLPAPVVEVTGDREFTVTWQWSGTARATYAFDIEVRFDGGDWQQVLISGDCAKFTFDDTKVTTVGSRTRTNSDIPSGTVIEGRYRYRNGSSCTGGSPGDWSEVGTTTVSGDGGGGRAGECVEGATYDPGEGCDVYGTGGSSSKERFEVLSDGRGRFGFFTAGNGISNRGGSINGVRYHFVASHQGGGTWKIDEYRP